MLMFHFLLINFFQTKLSNIQAQNVLQKPNKTKQNLISGIAPLALKKETQHETNHTALQEYLDNRYFTASRLGLQLS